MIYRNTILLLSALLMLAAMAGCDSPMDLDTVRRRVPEHSAGKEAAARIRPKYFAMKVKDMIHGREEEYLPTRVDIEIDTTYAPPHLYIHRFEGTTVVSWYDLLHSFKLRCDSLVLDRAPLSLIAPSDAPYGLEATAHTDMTTMAMKTIQGDGIGLEGWISGTNNMGAPGGCALELRLHAEDADFEVDLYDYKVTMTMQY